MRVNTDDFSWYQGIKDKFDNLKARTYLIEVPIHYKKSIDMGDTLFRGKNVNDFYPIIENEGNIELLETTVLVNFPQYDIGYEKVIEKSLSIGLKKTDFYNISSIIKILNLPGLFDKEEITLVETKGFHYKDDFWACSIWLNKESKETHFYPQSSYVGRDIWYSFKRR